MSIKTLLEVTIKFKSLGMATSRMRTRSLLDKHNLLPSLTVVEFKVDQLNGYTKHNIIHCLYKAETILMARISRSKVSTCTENCIICDDFCPVAIMTCYFQQIANSFTADQRILKLLRARQIIS